MELATGAMSSLLPKLAELLQDEYNLQTGVKKDVKSLSRELESIEVALTKVAEVPLDQLDKQVRLWARNVKQLSYEMEDIVDGFMVRVEGSEPDADLKRSKRFRKKIANFFKKGKTRHQIADKIQDIKVRVKEVADLRDRYKVDDVRRLALQSIDMDEEPNSDNTEICQVRSFNAIMCNVNRRSFLSSFQGLRILSMERCTFINDGSYHLGNLGRLLQLRYLGLLKTPITGLPEEIGNLRFLQILDLRGTKIKELPESVGQLRRLKCLRLFPDFTGALGWIGNLVLLEELLLPYVSLEIVKELGKLTELREYDAWFKKSDDAIVDSILFNNMMKSLEQLQKLQAIQVSCDTSWAHVDLAYCEGYVLSRQLRRLELRVVFEKLPAWINSSSLPNLSHLTVAPHAVETQDVEVLGRFPELVFLSLQTDPDVIVPDIMGGGAFPKLRYYLTTASARFLQGAMPSLECVEYHIRDECNGAKFERDIASIGNLPCLDRVKVYFYIERGTREKAVAALRQAVEVHPNNITVKLRGW